MTSTAMILAAALPLLAASTVQPIDPTTSNGQDAGRRERCLHGPFVQITQTTVTGEIVGRPDPNDWGCLDTGRPRGPGAGRRTIGLEDVPAPPPPTRLCLTEAAPNPALGATRLGITVPEETHLTLAIYAEAAIGRGRDASLIRTLLDATLRAGQHTVIWDLRDDHGARVAPGIYRAVLTTPAGILCGDIEVQ